MSPRLTQHRHCLTQAPLARRLSVLDARSARGGPRAWRRPTDAEQRRLLAPDGTGAQARDSAILQLFSIPPGLAVRLRGIASAAVGGATQSPLSDDRVQALIAELAELMEFIESPVSGPCAISLEPPATPDLDSLPSIGPHEATSAGIGARIYIDETPGALLYSALTDNDKRIWVRIDVAPCEGVFADFGLTPVWLCPGDPARSVPVLSLVPEAPR